MLTSEINYVTFVISDGYQNSINFEARMSALISTSFLSKV